MNTPADSQGAPSIAEVLPIVDAVVAQMSRRLPAHVAVQDLASAGKLALMELIRDFDVSLAEDRGYVVCRVRGAVMDEMRRLDPLSRYARSRLRLVRRAACDLETELGRAPTDQEVSTRLGLSEDEIRKIERLGSAAEALSADEAGARIRSIPDSDSPSPADAAEDSDTSSEIRKAVGRLARSQATVLMAYYFNGSTLQEIATDMEISVVRVHQIKASAEASLRADTQFAGARMAMHR